MSNIYTTSPAKELKELKKIAKNDDSMLKRFVANDILESCDDEPKSYIESVLQYGCVNGFVSSLIYYNDTYAFYDKYYSEIEDLRCEFEESTGEKIDLKSDTKNTMAWFAYEETARKIAQELGYEV